MSTQPVESARPVLRREWKGEKGLPVLIVQHGSGFRLRQPLYELLLEAADISGGLSLDRFALFRTMRVFAESAAEWLDRDSLREELGYQAWDDARPRLLDWLLVEERPGAAGSINHAYRVNPVAQMQLAPALNQAIETWRAVEAARWNEGELRLVRGDNAGESVSARDVAARLFDRSGARRQAGARGLLWLACVKLAENPDFEMDLSKGSTRAASALAPLRYYAIAAQGGEAGKWRWNPEAPRERLSEAIRYLRAFEGVDG